MTHSQTEDGNGPSKYQNFVLGCILAVCGNLLISISLIVQKYSHTRNARREESRHYTRDPLWWFGLVLMGLGELGNFSAYGFAPASLVAPLGTSTVIANLFLSALFLKETIRPENLFGCALAVIGSFLIVIFSSQHEKVMSAEDIISTVSHVPFIIYVCLEIGALGLLLFLLYGLKMAYLIIVLLISSVTASFTVISAKALSGMIQISIAGYSQFLSPMPYIMLVIMVVTLIIQVKFLNQAMKNFDSTVVVPTNFVLFTISAIVAGIVFYKEFYQMTVLDIGLFLFGCFLSFVGVFFITVGNIFGNSKLEAAPQRQVAAELVPSWMLANVNIGHVQPQGEVEHLIDPEQDVSDVILGAAECTADKTRDSLTDHKSSPNVEKCAAETEAFPTATGAGTTYGTISN